MANLQFDASQIKPQEGFDPIPPGWYHGRIIESEVKPTKNNDGGYLELTVEVIDGAHVNRKLFDRLNLWNANPTAVEIAQRRLSAYCHATGVMMVQDSQQLHGIPFNMKVSVKEDKSGQYEPSNEIKLVKHINEMVGTAPAGAPQQGGFTPPPSGGGFTPPKAGGFTPPAGPANPAPGPGFGAPPQGVQPPAWTPPQAQQGAPAAAPWQPPQAPPQAPQQTPPQAPPQAGPVPPWAQKR